MILIALSPKLLEVKHAAYCTIVSPLSRHTIFAPTPIGTPVHTSTLRRRRFLGPELSDAECRRESRQALTGSTLIPKGTEGEDYSEFLICGVRQLGEQRLCVCKETQRWQGRPLGRKRWWGAGGVL